MACWRGREGEQTRRNLRWTALCLRAAEEQLKVQTAPLLRFITTSHLHLHKK